MENYKLVLSYITLDGSSVEHSSSYPSLSEAQEDADDVAFHSVGYPLENWKEVDFGEGNALYLFYPNEEDMSSRYKLSILKEVGRG